MPLLAPRRNMLAYPAGVTPGFDPAHPMSAGINIARGLSAVAVPGAGMVSLLSGQAGVNSVVTAAINGQIGPVAGFASANSTLDFGNQSTANAPDFTFAGIAYLSSITGTLQYFGGNSQGSNGTLIASQATTGAFVVIHPSQATISSNLTFVAGVPYFWAVSHSGAKSNFLLMRLDTGQITIDGTQTANPTVSAGNGTYRIGNRIASNALVGAVAAFMWSPQFVSMQQLLAWARDPWSFWYPQPLASQRKTSFYPQPSFVGGATPRAKISNLLVYPSGVVPGFDPKHLAVTGRRDDALTSAIAVGPNLTSLLSGLAGTQVGTVDAAIDGVIGPVTRTQPTNTNYVTLPFTTASLTSFTVAAIINTGDRNNATQQMVTNNTGGGFALSMSNASTIAYELLFCGTRTGVPMERRTPYFCVGSISPNQNTVNLLQLNLLTGQFVCVTGSGPGAVNNSGGFLRIGSVGANAVNFAVAAVMMSRAYLSMAQLQAWAKDPWSFWYPRSNVIKLRPADQIIGGARVQQRYNRPALPYPLGAMPGFDPSHIAAKGISAGRGFSAVCLGNSFVNVSSGKAFTQNGTPTFNITAAKGPGGVFTALSTQSFSLPGQSTAAEAAGTLAFIGEWTTTGGHAVSTNNNVAGVGVTLYSSGGTIQFYDGANNVNSSFTPTVGVPYFIAASRTGTLSNFVFVNLTTGQINTASVSAAGFAGGANTGTYLVGGAGTAYSGGWGGGIACAMYAPSFMSMTQLLGWAKDPWSFWYPNPRVTKLALTDAGPVVPSNVSVTITFTGIQLTASTGSLVASIDRSASLTGIQLQVQFGSTTETVDESNTATGIVLQVQLGTLSETVDDSVGLTGVQVTVALGTVSVLTGTTIGISGISLQAMTGTVAETVDDSASLTGISDQVLLGTVTETVDESNTLTGIQLQALFGSVTETISPSVSLTGIQLTVTFGTVSAGGAVNIGVSGIQLTASLGTLGKQIDDSVGLNGITVQAFLGSVLARVDDSTPLTGIQAQVQLGQVTIPTPGSVNITGVMVQVLTGTVSAVPVSTFLVSPRVVYTLREDRTVNVAAENRVVTPTIDGADDMLQWPSRDPAEDPLDYDVNWTKRLAGDTIISSTWAAPVPATGITVTDEDFSTTRTKIWLDDGTLGTTYTFKNTITTQAGRTMVQSAQITIVTK